jgi:hypothetical protein
MLPLPSRTHPQKQTPVVYTEELTHLKTLGLNILACHDGSAVYRVFGR